MSPPDSRQLFEQLIRPHLERLYRLAFRLTGKVPDAEDLVQDVLVKLYRRRGELTSIEDLAPWLGRVLYNQFVDDRRRYARARLHIVDEQPREGLPESAPSPDPGPETEARRAFDISRLERALERLSEEHRVVVLLHDTEGYTLEEIHRITAVPVGTLKSRLHRARARLRELLGEGMEPFGLERRVSG